VSKFMTQSEMIDRSASAAEAESCRARRRLKPSLRNTPPCRQIAPLGSRGGVGLIWARGDPKTAAPPHRRSKSVLDRGRFVTTNIPLPRRTDMADSRCGTADPVTIERFDRFTTQCQMSTCDGSIPPVPGAPWTRARARGAGRSLGCRTQCASLGAVSGTPIMQGFERPALSTSRR
jgi:hypothetical protein